MDAETLLNTGKRVLNDTKKDRKLAIKEMCSHIVDLADFDEDDEASQKSITMLTAAKAYESLRWDALIEAVVRIEAKMEDDILGQLQGLIPLVKSSLHARQAQQAEENREQRDLLGAAAQRGVNVSTGTNFGDNTNVDGDVVGNDKS